MIGQSTYVTYETDGLTDVSLPPVDILQVRYAHERHDDSRRVVG